MSGDAVSARRAIVRVEMAEDCSRCFISIGEDATPALAVNLRNPPRCSGREKDAVAVPLAGKGAIRARRPAIVDKGFQTRAPPLDRPLCNARPNVVAGHVFGTYASHLQLPGIVAVAHRMDVSDLFLFAHLARRFGRARILAAQVSPAAVRDAWVTPFSCCHCQISRLPTSSRCRAILMGAEAIPSALEI